MYNKVSTEDALAEAKKQNEALQAQLVTANANIAYLSLAAGITSTDLRHTDPWLYRTEYPSDQNESTDRIRRFKSRLPSDRGRCMP